MAKLNIHQVARTQTFVFKDIIIDSSELKKLIRYRIKELNINTYVLCKANNVSYSVFKKYLNNDKSLSTPSLRQEHMIRIAESLGIRIRVQLIVGKIEDVDRSVFDNAFKKDDEQS